MKKYLMTGIAALALCAGFTACSSTDDYSFNEEEYAQLQIGQMQAQYEQAFVKVFGKAKKNHDWGFSDNTTRSGNTGETYAYTHGDANGGANMNHNEWADPDKKFGGWVVPDPLTAKQKAVVTAYFQAHPNIDFVDPHFRHFFVQQVYKGGSAQAGTSTENITAASNSVYNSDNMNLLTVGETNIHINDFNAGTCSESDVLNNGQKVGGTSHKDQITLMVNIDDTSCFGYHETGSSTHHNDKAALVGWETIDTWAKTNYPGYDGCLKDKWNRSFLGFDLAIKEGSDALDAATVKYNDGPESYSYALVNGEVVSIDGNSEILINGKPIQYASTNTNMYVAAEKTNMGDGDIQAEYRVNGQLIGKYINVDNIMAKLNDGWVPVKDKNLREWVKVGKSDGYFSDWIVTLTEAKRIPGPEVKKVRVICEDLNATLGGYKGDFDFNDAVFDLYLDENDKVTEIELIWTGAEYDILVDGKEIHECLGIEKGKFSTQLGSYKFTPKAGAGVKSPAEIVVVAKRYWEETVDGEKKQMTGDLTLDAQQGKAPGKILVKPTFQIVPERTAIDKYYPKFKEYVKNPTVEWYEESYK